MPCLKGNTVHIDLGALVENLAALKALLAKPDVGIMAVIKSDAYGHGLIQVAKALWKHGIWGFGISEIEEAIALRQAGIKSPILLLSGLCQGTEEQVLGLDLITGVPDLGTLEGLERAASKRGVMAKVHLKIDTGMGRLGLTIEELIQIVRDRSHWPHLRFTGLYSHLSAADDPGDPFNQDQIQRFEKAIVKIKALGWHPPEIHLANSAGLIHFKNAHHHLTRPGIALYGAYPGDQARLKLRLRPVMSFKSQVISIRSVPKGFPISYGHTYYTKRPSKIAVVPVGYDDGYPRSLSNKAWALVRGIRCPVIGSICMKALMLDVTKAEGVRQGDEVVFLGRQGQDTITIEELAMWAGTISYELLCLLGTRNQRHFIKER